MRLTRDPTYDRHYMIKDGIIHKYQNRLLLISNNSCVKKCPFCFRQNTLSDLPLFKINDLLEILKNRRIDEIIFSGGDPFLIRPTILDDYLKKLHGKVDFVRLHTRSIIDGMDPSKIVKVLKKHQSFFKKIIIVIHINNLKELNSKNISNLKKIDNFLVLSQTVLLKNINDNAKMLKDLFLKLNDLNIIPYYLHQLDLAKGTKKFYVNEKKGKAIFKELNNILPGWLVPRYVKDGILGKRPLTF